MKDGGISQIIHIYYWTTSSKFSLQFLLTFFIGPLSSCTSTDWSGWESGSLVASLEVLIDILEVGNL